MIPKPASSLLVGMMVGVGIILLYGFDPLTSKFYPPCIFYRLTHWYCPGCGTGRALHALLHLQWKQAFSYNPILFPMLIFLGWDKIRSYYQLSGKWYLLPQKWQPYREWILVGVVMLYWIARNIPLYPFSCLSPK
ncbi:MAG: DUF2752 domain-containing protein [bacterium]|nr:DUF2752 domain-containing protein [bacterium]